MAFRIIERQFSELCFMYVYKIRLIILVLKAAFLADAANTSKIYIEALK